MSKLPYVKGIRQPCPHGDLCECGAAERQACVCPGAALAELPFQTLGDVVIMKKRVEATIMGSYRV